MKRKLFATLFLLTTLSNLWAGDNRFGFATHFGQNWPVVPVMAAIASTGVSYIRDDVAWSACEKVKGVYSLDPQDAGWIDGAAANGLKVVAILNPNPIYANKWDPSAAAAFCAWLAKKEGTKIAAIEVVNEPNNAYAAYIGSTWETKLVTLTNAIYAAVHAVSPSTQVIGLDAQGTQIFDMFAMGAKIDGVAYHPYSNGFVPEKVYEWQYSDYGKWIQALGSKTTLPFWETEWGIQTTPTFTQVNQTNFIARRLLQAAGLGVEHTFIYEFKDNQGELMGVESSNPMAPKPAFYVVQRIISALSGAPAAPTSVTVNSVANGDVTDLKAFIYHGSINKTVVAVWFGNYDPRTPPHASTCNLTFTVSHPYSNPYVLNVITGQQVNLATAYSCSLVGNQFSVRSFDVSDSPRLIVIQ